MTDRRGFQKERTKMLKRKQRDERKEAECQQKGGYEKNVKESSSGNIQIQNRDSEPKMERVSNPLCPFCNTYLPVNHILWE
jgi:hypothetical protein